MEKAQREQKIKDMLVIIRSDFQKMHDLTNPHLLVGGNAVASQVYLHRQIGKYLKPLDNADFGGKVKALLKAFDTPALLNVADYQGTIAGKPNWDTEGESTDHVNGS